MAFSLPRVPERVARGGMLPGRVMLTKMAGRGKAG